MSTKYKDDDRIPSKVIIDRLQKLAKVVTKGEAGLRREFTMRVPAERDRDADLILSDLILSEAAERITELEEGNKQLLEKYMKSVKDKEEQQRMPFIPFSSFVENSKSDGSSEIEVLEEIDRDA
jgi:hypothetical protein